MSETEHQSNENPSEQRLEEVRRAAISHRNCQIEASRYPHGKTLTNAKLEKRRYETALWAARDEIEAILTQGPHDA